MLSSRRLECLAMHALVRWIAAAALGSSYLVAPALAHRGMVDPSGEIVLSDWPFCETFVLRGPHGFSVAHWMDGIWVFARGDEVYGRADVVGRHTLLSVGRVTAGRLVIEVDAVFADRRQAERTFWQHCTRPDPVVMLR
jgi:hypothetical protein